MKAEERLRLFVAVDIPEQHLIRLDEAAAPLKQRFPSARWAPVANQHVTLKFLGSTPSDRLEDLKERCADVASHHDAATIGLAEVGTFPSGRRMRVLWVGLRDPDGLMTRLAADLDRALEPLGFEAEQRAFTPHLTLARFKAPERIEGPPAISGVPDEPFLLDRLVLYRSRLSPKGARYEPLHDFALVATRNPPS